MAKEWKPAKEKPISARPQELSEAQSSIQALQRALDVEAAVNRVRDRTMDMQKSSELQKVSELLYAELRDLGVFSDLMSYGYIEVDNEKQIQHAWMTRPDGTSISDHRLPLTGNPVMDKRYAAWKAQEPIFSQALNSEALKNHWHFARPYFDNQEVESIVNFLPDPTIFYCANFKQGYLHIVTATPLTSYEESLLIRFTRVFAQTYTRFLDLKKAEEQAREAQIQLALERVRTRTMAMHKSEELPETSHILFEEMKEFGEPVEQLTIGIIDEENNVVEISATLLGDTLKKIHRHSIDEPYMMNKIYKAWKKQQKTLVVELRGDEVNAYNKYRNELTNSEIFPTNFGEEHRRIVYAAFFSKGMLALGANEPRPPQSIQLLERFASAFDLTYTRFLDLKKAEAQAREAQIEVGLERIRARALAMHHSGELEEVALVLREQMRFLDQPELDGCVIELYEVDPNRFESWYAFPQSENGNKKMTTGKVLFDKDACTITKEMIAKYKSAEKNYTIVASRKELQEWNEIVKASVGNPFGSSESISRNEISTLYYHCSDFSGGTLLTVSCKELLDDVKKLQEKAASVFDLAYKRFLDLKKAEDQVREAQIEAALERIRSRTMAMRKSDDLQDVVTTVAERLHDLGIVVDAGGVIICTYFSNSKDVRHWIAAPDFSYSGSYLLPYFDHVIFNDAWESRLRGDEFHTKAYTVEEKDSFFKYAFEHSDYQYFPDDFKQWMFAQKKHTLTFAWTKNAALLIPSHTGYVPSIVERDILQRFAQVFEQAYIRFLDIQKAEAQAREAIKQAALDRVRGEIASMRTSEDLNRITPVIWRELQVLNVPFIRCGVFIIDAITENVEAYLTTPEGQALAVLHFTPDANELTHQTVIHWKKKQMYKAHWGRKDFMEWTQSMITEGQVENAETYQGAAAPPDSLDLYFTPFRQGMLYVGNVVPLSDDKLELVRTLAEAFSIAYARYEDFKNLETAKLQVEKTLNELQQTQQQLIQSEKMASLGELTAGIAHEIQNPLNFINNFSEINQELSQELEEELKNGKNHEAISLSKDIRENSIKITEHGKRADAIVKNMLQHSRSSAGEKEIIDINRLCEEYLRLAYHGFRAKDQSFHPELNLHLDPTLPKINVVPQEIGRVLLNLFNNAFHACTSTSLSTSAQRSRSDNFTQKGNGPIIYIPEVIISTLKMEHSIEIRIKDNGPGIPDDIKNKIFQPFFTTKPTGQGTGLGLSLSYDIITKGHGGNLKFKSNEGQGTEFIIQLPIGDL